MKQREKSYDVDPTPAPGDVKSEVDSSQQLRQNSSDPYFGLHFHCFSTLSVRLAQGVILVLHPEWVVCVRGKTIATIANCQIIHVSI